MLNSRILDAKLLQVRVVLGWVESKLIELRPEAVHLVLIQVDRRLGVQWNERSPLDILSLLGKIDFRFA